MGLQKAGNLKPWEGIVVENAPLGILQRMNREHYLEAVKSMGGDDFNTRLIWQKRPEL